MSTTAGHPNCLRIAVILFLLTFALCVGALSAQDIGGQDASRVSLSNGQGADSGTPQGILARVDSAPGGVAEPVVPVRSASSTRNGRAFSLTTAGYLALSASDFYLSNKCIQSGRCIEVGSYRGVASHPLAFALVKMGASSALAATAWSLRKHHKKAAWGTLIGLTVAQAGVVYWNSQQGVRK